MKKYFITMCIALVGFCAFAQKGEKSVGLNFSYGTPHSNLGIGIKGQYNFTDAIRGELSGDYFLGDDMLNMWDININAHYLFNVAEKIKVYPLVGVTYTNWNVDFDFWGESYSESTGRFGANLGGGVQYDINDIFAVDFEAKYQLIGDWNQLVFGIGAVYKF